MTDNEIIKSLEYCSYYDVCLNCPCFSFCGCTPELLESALDLINRQKAEIEKCENIIRLADKTIEKQSAEIERLRNDLAKEFVCFVGSPHKVENCPFFEELENERAEAIKEFAERLKLEAYYECVGTYRYQVVTIEDIDNLVKEMVGKEL